MPPKPLPVQFRPPSKILRQNTPERIEGFPGAHCHPHWELGLVLHGGGRLELRGRGLQISEGDLYVLSPGTAHHERAHAGGMYPVIAYIALDADQIPGCPEGCRFLARREGLDFIPLFTSIAREVAQRAEGWEAVIDSEIKKLLVYLKRPQAVPVLEVDPVRLAFREDLVSQWKTLVENEGLKRDFRIGSGGRVGPLSLRRFQTFFKEATGLTCKAWVLRHRLERARHLLEFGRMPLGEIAEACGFADVYHFNRSFKAHSGVPPARYRMGAGRQAWVPSAPASPRRPLSSAPRRAVRTPPRPVLPPPKRTSPS